jgi:hypothetical protein
LEPPDACGSKPEPRVIVGIAKDEDEIDARFLQQA